MVGGGGAETREVSRGVTPRSSKGLQNPCSPRHGGQDVAAKTLRPWGGCGEGLAQRAYLGSMASDTHDGGGRRSGSKWGPFPCAVARRHRFPLAATNRPLRPLHRNFRAQLSGASEPLGRLRRALLRQWNEELGEPGQAGWGFLRSLGACGRSFEVYRTYRIFVKHTGRQRLDAEALRVFMMRGLSKQVIFRIPSLGRVRACQRISPKTFLGPMPEL